MAYQSMPKLSLVAQYDDLCRYTKILTTDTEEEFKIFVKNQLNCVRDWKEVEGDVKKLHDKISSLESEGKRLETQIRHLRNVCEDEVVRRKKVDAEKSSLERQIALIKEVLLADTAMNNQTKEKLAFLNSTSKPNLPTRLDTIEESIASFLSISDVTEDNIDDTRRSSRRRSRRSKERQNSPEYRLSPKKKRVDTEEESDNNYEIRTPYNAPIRSNSESSLPSSEIHGGIFHANYKSDSDQFEHKTHDSKRYNTGSQSVGTTPNGQYTTRGKLSQVHSFVEKTVFHPEKCYSCAKIVKLFKQVLKCQDCRVICHPECRDQSRLPCIPIVNTQTKIGSGTIADYTPSTPPMIPSLIVYCVNEIESRGFKKRGLYSTSGSEQEVKDLKDKFLRGRTIPSLSQIDIHVVCGTVKEFLRSLKEPLITRATWQAFVDAADLKDLPKSIAATYENLSNLPQPNRDTLVFFILHLQRVKESSQCKMRIWDLAVIFGPSVVGYSVANPPDTRMFRETTKQCKVMERLLCLPSHMLEGMLNVETGVVLGNIRTPEMLHAQRSRRLGPILSSGQKTKIINFGKTTPTLSKSKLSKRWK